MEINNWLNKFKESWQNRDILKILGLFDKEVVYYETPSTKLNYDELAKE